MPFLSSKIQLRIEVSADRERQGGGRATDRCDDFPAPHALSPRSNDRGPNIAGPKWLGGVHRKKKLRLMSGWGQKRKARSEHIPSELPPRADIVDALWHF
jgi:hypothetical protein